MNFASYQFFLFLPIVLARLASEMIAYFQFQSPSLS
jgi:hypothetical protein